MAALQISLERCRKARFETQPLVPAIGERRERWQLMMEALRNNTIDTWSANFLKALRAVRALD